ncbi:hypothetical protein [Pasteuria penetrans]|uniref:hypothetical protein n=1 Tax=Pasteuria penetrans TaxID=86005 RepID=UPI000F93BA76|nr:hypothetical protein [Pasteuria penetrans]
MDVQIIRNCGCYSSFLLSYTFPPPSVIGRPGYDICLRMEPLPVIEVGDVVRIRGEFTSYNVGDDCGYDILYTLGDDSQVSLCSVDLKRLTTFELHLNFRCKNGRIRSQILQEVQGGMFMKGAPQGFERDPRRPPVLAGDLFKVVYLLSDKYRGDEK